MEKEIEKAIRETLVIENTQSIHIAVNKILLLFSVSGQSEELCGSFDPDNSTSSATKCKCGREKWEHQKAT